MRYGSGRGHKRQRALRQALWCGLCLALAACGSSGGASSARPTATTRATPTPSVPTISAPELSYKGHSGPVVAVAWSPDGKRLASCGNDGTAQVWDATTGATLWHASVAPFAFAVAWSPDGHTLAAAGSSGSVAILDAGTGNQATTFSGQSGAIEGLAWSPDGKSLA